MRPADPDLVDALAAGERRYAAQVRLGGVDVTDEVAEWSVDRGYDTGLPASVAAPIGSSAAQAQITLAGSGTQTAAQRYSPWAPRAAADITRPGQSAVLAWGLEEQQFQTLRGRVRTIAADSRAGTAQVTALDGAELLRGRAWLPPAVAPSLYGIKAAWCVDHALRMSGIYTSPPPRANPIFYASMFGSVEANLGMRMSSSGSLGYDPARSPWNSGPYVSSGQWSVTWAPQRRTLSQQSTLQVDWWFYRRNTSDNALSQVELVWRQTETSTPTTVTLSYDPAARAMRAAVDGGATTWTLPTSVNQAGRFKLSWQIAMTTTSAATQVRGWLYQPNGALYASPTYSGAAPVWGLLHTITATSAAPMECVGVARVSGTVPVVETWQRAAVVDLMEFASPPGNSQYGLDVLPDVSGTWWDMLRSIAQANLAYMGWDEDGVFRFRRYEFVTPDSSGVTPNLTVTAAREIADVTVSEEIDGVANMVQVGLEVQGRATTPTQSYTHGSVTTIPGSGSVSVTPDLSQRAQAMRTPMLYTASTLPTSGPSAVKLITAAGAIAPVEIEMTWDTGAPVVTYHNRSSTAAYAALDTGLSAPSLRLAWAQPSSTTMLPVTRTDATSIARYGVQALEIGVSPWVQNAFWADNLALRLITWTAASIPLTGAVEILPDPRLQLGDVVQIMDPTGSMISGNFRVLGYQVHGSGSSVTMSVDVRPLYRPAPPADAGLTPDPITDPAAAPPING
ncbi:hypothetical protein [Marinitenerispora sediminis]|uniref:Uncharacterized protein n=1 Tax=Marinitenerispora sediminis TaxID=1931232 RepID=A0A368T708_9ACTN|nr:hypothetical protein [Marinitenerispora sediminis]RCV53466.1 hypothetical protein DEF23_17455 [Marinitenerispora sediminis]RCV59294.1 hypothetical protein DEF24_09995 [Marinitenerispora sediminis]